MNHSFMTYITGVAHIGIAVPDILTAAKQYRLVGYEPLTPEIIYEQNHGVQAYMMENDGFVIELLAPLEKGKESPVDNYITKKPYTIYHIAYYTSNLEAQIDLLKANKFIMTGKPGESALQKGKRAVFLANRKMGVIELVEE